MTSSCLKRSASILAAQSASTSGATRTMTDDAEVKGDRLCAFKMFAYASAYDARLELANCGGERYTIALTINNASKS